MLFVFSEIAVASDSDGGVVRLPNAGDCGLKPAYSFCECEELSMGWKPPVIEPNRKC